MLLQNIGFCPFSWLNDIPLCTTLMFLPSLYNIFIHSCVDGYLSCFHVTMGVFPIPLNRKTGDQRTRCTCTRHKVRSRGHNERRHWDTFVVNSRTYPQIRSHIWAWTENLFQPLKTCNKLSISIHFLSSDKLKQSNWD